MKKRLFHVDLDTKKLVKIRKLDKMLTIMLLVCFNYRAICKLIMQVQSYSSYSTIIRVKTTTGLQVVLYNTICDMKADYQLGNTRVTFFKDSGHELGSSQARPYEVKFMLSLCLTHAQDVLKTRFSFCTVTEVSEFEFGQSLSLIHI